MKNSLTAVSAFVSDLDKEELLRDEDAADISPVEEEAGRKSIRCASIDNFQGEESDIVIICLV